jgi:uncharacterized protein YbaR (Trm112 family)
VRDALRCPVDHATLDDVGEPGEVKALSCASCGRVYPVTDGIPVLLESDAMVGAAAVTK